MSIPTPAPIEISRLFAAPRETVFEAWSHADHIKRWFSPAGCSVPEAEVDFRVGGVFAYCMRMPWGEAHWVRGHFEEIVAPERLVFTLDVEMAGEVRFTARTVVTFVAEPPGTRMNVRQDYTLYDPAFAGAPAGALEGWRTTLDKLEAEIARIRSPFLTPASFGSFTLRRSYRASPERVFHALSDPQAKGRWFVGGAEYALLERVMDVRPGGRERVSGRWPSGVVSTFDAIYFDVVAPRRLVYAYEMHLDERKISVSLATMEIASEGEGSRLSVTEQGAFLNGYEDAGSREHGTGALLDRLGVWLEAN